LPSRRNLEKPVVRLENILEPLLVRVLETAGRTGGRDVNATGRTGGRDVNATGRLLRLLRLQVATNQIGDEQCGDDCAEYRPKREHHPTRLPFAR
jgi:hypothetical protein